MSITLKNLRTGELEALPPELYWVDEFDWTAVKGNHKRSCTGSLMVLQSIANGGRPITIGAKSDMNWTPRHTVEKLQSWASVVGMEIEVQMAYNDVVKKHKVVFDTTGKPIEATPVCEYEAPSPKDDFHLTVKLIEVRT